MNFKEHDQQDTLAKALKIEPIIKAEKESVEIKKEVKVIKETASAAKTVEGKLIRRINKEFSRCKYIGDIRITDEEYEILMDLFLHKCRRICQTSGSRFVDPVFATALVQIGIKKYDGNYWNHVEKIADMLMTPSRRTAISKCFFDTLKHYGKICGENKNELVNNVLMHCFITDYYAAELFDFLFAYYNLDLDRDLQKHTKETRDFLMRAMKKSEESSREYKIKKHTADAVTANDRGCRIRVGNILRLIDNAWFEDILPTDSNNRIAQLFVKWTQESARFKTTKKKERGVSRNGQKRFSSPYIHYAGEKEEFTLVIPPQIIPLESGCDIPTVYLSVEFSNGVHQFELETIESVTGCKTKTKKDILLPAECLLDEIQIRLLTESSFGEQAETKKFRIKKDLFRLFDRDGDMLVVGDHLLPGRVYAFAKTENEIVFHLDCEIVKENGLYRYAFDFEKGDFVKFPNGKAYSVGRSLSEGMLEQGNVTAVCYKQNDETYPVYKLPPMVFFKVEAGKESGIRVSVNGTGCRLDIADCIPVDVDGEKRMKGYVLSLENYVIDDGCYEITVDVPASKKEREYRFVYVRGLVAEYVGAPYVFKDDGLFRLSQNVMVRSSDLKHRDADMWTFPILPEQDELHFVLDIHDKQIELTSAIPSLKWKFDDDMYWNTEPVEDIWYADLPKEIHLKGFEDTGAFYMSPLILEDQQANEDLDSEENCREKFSRKATEDHIVYDTRKLISWLGKEEAKRDLKMEMGGKTFLFATIITRCFLNGCKFDESKSADVRLKASISGYNNCVADVFLDGELLFEKQEITTRGIPMGRPKNGNYCAVFYERDDDDDFDVSTYEKIGQKQLAFHRTYPLERGVIAVERVVQRKTNSFIFGAEKYVLNHPLIVSKLAVSEEGNFLYKGIAEIGGISRIVGLYMENENEKEKWSLSFYDEDAEKWKDFIYDRNTRQLLTNREVVICAAQNRERYLLLAPKEFYFEIKLLRKDVQREGM